MLSFLISLGIRNCAATASAVLACCVFFSSATYAVDINGAWASDVAVCNKVFVKKGGQISIANDADIYGSGFIIQRGKIRGKIASCTIKSVKEDGSLIHILATCATDIMVSDTQFSLKIIDDNKMAREFSGSPEMKTDYFRCSF